MDDDNHKLQLQVSFAIIKVNKKWFKRNQSILNSECFRLRHANHMIRNLSKTGKSFGNGHFTIDHHSTCKYHSYQSMKP